MFLVGTKGITEPFDHPEKYSKIFKDFISKCLEYDQNKRMSAEDLLKVKKFLLFFKKKKFIF